MKVGTMEAVNFPLCGEARALVLDFPWELRRGRIVETALAGLDAYSGGATSAVADIYQRCLWALNEPDRAHAADMVGHLGGLMDAGRLPRDPTARGVLVKLAVGWGEIHGLADFAWLVDGTAHVVRLWTRHVPEPDPAGRLIAWAYAREHGAARFVLHRITPKGETTGEHETADGAEKILEWAARLCRPGDGGPVVSSECALRCPVARRCAAWWVPEKLQQGARIHEVPSRLLNQTAPLTEAQIVNGLRVAAALSEVAERIRTRAEIEVRAAGKPLRDGDRWEWGEQADGSFSWRKLK